MDPGLYTEQQGARIGLKTADHRLKTRDQGQWMKEILGWWTFISWIIDILRYIMSYYQQQRWHSALCTEGFSPGTPVSLTPEKPIFPNSNLTRLRTHCCDRKILWLLKTDQFIFLWLFSSYMCICGLVLYFAAVILANEQIGNITLFIFCLFRRFLFKS